MGEDSRCGSVTDLLQCTVDLYVPPSPRHQPPPDPDCWGDPGRITKQEKDTSVDAVPNDPSNVSDNSKNTESQATDQRDERLDAKEQTQNSSRVSNVKVGAQNKVETETKTVKDKNKPGMKPRRPKPGAGPDQTKPRAPATDKCRPVAKPNKTTLQGHKTAGRGVQVPSEDTLPVPSKPRCGE